MVDRWSSENVAELVTLAEAGDPFWQMHLGWVYYNGTLLPKDIPLATIWMNRALENGSDEVKFEVAKFYYVLDDPNVLPILDEMSAKNCIYGLYLYGMIYNEGKLVPRDVATSRQLWERASKRGHLFSRGELLRHRLIDAHWINKPYLLVQFIKNSFVAGVRRHIKWDS